MLRYSGFKSRPCNMDYVYVRTVPGIPTRVTVETVPCIQSIGVMPKPLSLPKLTPGERTEARGWPDGPV